MGEGEIGRVSGGRAGGRADAQRIPGMRQIFSEDVYRNDILGAIRGPKIIRGGGHTYNFRNIHRYENGDYKIHWVDNEMETEGYLRVTKKGFLLGVAPAVEEGADGASRPGDSFTRRAEESDAPAAEVIRIPGRQGDYIGYNPQEGEEPLKVKFSFINSEGEEVVEERPDVPFDKNLIGLTFKSSFFANQAGKINQTDFQIPLSINPDMFANRTKAHLDLQSAGVRFVPIYSETIHPSVKKPLKKWYLQNVEGYRLEFYKEGMFIATCRENNDQHGMGTPGELQDFTIEVKAPSSEE